jgi:hypothetical protein
MPKAKPEGIEKENVERDAVTYQVIRGTVAGPGAGNRRTFSKQVNGDDFEEQAKAWGEKFNAAEVE